MISKLIKKYKAQIGDSLWSLMGLVLMNAVAQLLVFPVLDQLLGRAGYGDMQYLMAYINIIAVSVGCAANMARITAPPEERLSNNGDYHLFLLIVCVLGLPFTVLVSRFGGVVMDHATTVGYYLLFVTMTFRYYADVSYKLTLCYRGYFVYYLMIGVGYAIGIVLAWRTGIWPLSLLVGELMGVLYAFLGDDTLRCRALRPSPALRRVAYAVLLLSVSEGISNLIHNADRLIIKWFIGSEAVTVYYLATIVGKMMLLITMPLGSVLLGYLARYEGGVDRRQWRRVLLGGLVAVAVCTLACMLGGLIILSLFYPSELDAVRPYLFLGSLAQVLFFTTGILALILVRFAKKAYQLYINGVFGICFFGIGIPATVFGGLWGFAGAMVAVNAIRYLLSALLGFRAMGASKPCADNAGIEVK